VRTFDRSATRERAFKPPFKAKRVPNADEMDARESTPAAGPRSLRERPPGAGDFSGRPERPRGAKSPKHARKPGPRPPRAEDGRAPFRPGAPLRPGAPKAGRPGPRPGPKPHRKGPRKPGAGGPPARGRR
jgi:hypothetical protein